MGLGASLPEEDLAELLKTTQYEKNTLIRWYKKFMKDFPEGKLTKEQFHEILGKTYQKKFSTHSAEHIFRIFDSNNDGYVCFKELMVSFSVTTNGKTDEKLEWLFNVYDMDGNGKITMDEVCHMIQCMQSHSSTNVISHDNIVDMFRSVDRDSNNYWSLDEFKNGTRRHALFKKLLKLVTDPDY